eukprot:TRINITY_DN2473_c0_g3_i1.p1 TRINITY_DN2473_c0_g3~~TRINITY_DN2473_c0_g3_i1.p1  ORF type:complete len:3331 (+),score=578.52 TRINITY_DN2473_c0_g3_i1:683-9994(+)
MVASSSSMTQQHVGEAVSPSRRWVELDETWDGAGRFALSAPQIVGVELADRDFASWLSSSVDSAPVEVNINFGQLQIRQHTVTPVPREVLQLPEFREVFPHVDANTFGLMWAMVERAPNRERYRIAGLSYEFRLWKPDFQNPVVEFPRPFPTSACASEEWLSDVLRKEDDLREFWSSSAWCSPTEAQTKHLGHLATQIPSCKSSTETDEHDYFYDDGYGYGDQGRPEPVRQQADEPEETVILVKEVEVFRHPATGGPPVVHVYAVMKSGPRFVRTQIFTSDARWSNTSSFDQQDRAMLFAASVRPEPTLEIVHQDASGESTLVAQRFLKGALPDALLETYEFWRGLGGRLVGKMKPAARRRAAFPTALVVHLGAEGSCHILRTVLDAASRVDEERQLDQLLHGASDKVGNIFAETLLDLLHATPGSAAWEVASWALQLDDPSHVLAWTQAQLICSNIDEGQTLQVEVVEFPRLGLSFTVCPESYRPRCDQHGGLKVVSATSFDNRIGLCRLLQPFPRYVLLEDDAGELSVLVSLADRPGSPGSARGAVIRGDSAWLDALRTDHRHQLFAIHASMEFLVPPTLVAELHLMLLRICSGMFCEACSGVVACTASGAPQEPEELVIWQEITTALRGECSLDAAVLRLKLVLQIHRQGQGPPEGWNPEADLMAWTLHGTESQAGRLLTLEEDAALLDLLAGGSSQAAWEFRTRGEVHKLLRLRAARALCTVQDGGSQDGEATISCPPTQWNRLGPNVLRRQLLDRVPEQEFLAALMAPGNDDEADCCNLSLLLASALGAEGPEIAGGITGSLAVPWLLRRLPLQLPRDFLFLYELLTGARSIWLTPSDDPSLTGQVLTRLIAPGQLAANPALAGLLRLLAAKATLAESLPRLDRRDFGAWANELCTALNTCGRDTICLPQPSQNSNGEDDAARHHGSPDGSSTPQQASEEGKPLSNARLFKLLAAMKQAGDRRLPSQIWDFDCGYRVLGALPTLCQLAPSRPPATDGEEYCEDDFAEICQRLSQRLHGLGAGELPLLATQPLLALGLGSLVSKKERGGGQKDTASLRTLGVEQSKAGTTSAGQALFKRLSADFAWYSSLEELDFFKITADSAPGMLRDRARLDELLEHVERLLETFSAMLLKDKRGMHDAIAAAVVLANGGKLETPTGPERQFHLTHLLGQLGGTEAKLTFSDLMHLMLIDGGLETVLPHICPLLRAQEIGDLAMAVMLAMLRSSRSIMCKQSMAQLHRLRDIVQRARGALRGDSPARRSRRTSLMHRVLAPIGRRLFAAEEDSGEQLRRCDNSEEEQAQALELAEAAEQTALNLSAELHSMKGIGYDPRLVSFEFITRIALRKKQVSLVRTMQGTLADGKPLVHQMLMGEGKTTVVTPLLVLLHSTAERICIVCCPAALTEFTCKVLRERLCSAIARPVLQFNFTRSTAVTEDVFFRLLHAQAAHAVLCAGPTALKSLMLRFLLTLHLIDVTHSEEHERQEKEKNTTPGFLLSFSWQSLLSWPGQCTQDAAQERLGKLHFEVLALVCALKVFRGAMLLLDDIDLLMHPLRSELHWPLGESHMLDFTSEVGSAPGWASDVSDSLSFVTSSAVGTRWQVAFHILDGFFSCQLTEGPAVASFEGQGEAAKVLRKLRTVVQQGLEGKQLQASPHLAILSSDFYHDMLRPILAEWMLLWLKRWQPLAVADATVLKYLCNGQTQGKESSTPSNDASEGLAMLTDAQMKALNLCHSWLFLLLPHLASRVHRVHYGLLDEESTSWPREPRARRNLAVPFAGKDAPSDASQFSHPDVLIGLTWLAFRFAGLRRGDFRAGLQSLLKLQKSEADLAPNTRKAHRLYNSWVRLKGAHVRGEVDGMELCGGQHNYDQILVMQHSTQADIGVQVVPPLQWIDLHDDSQIQLISTVLGSSPFFLEFYLHDYLFPRLLRHTDSKLSADGQDLGGEAFCGSRLGFSGTPNDLLPRSMGRCVYAKGDDARMLTTLSDSQVVDVCNVQNSWNPRNLLELVVRMSQQQPPLNALIDVGALITGYSNVQVAQELLDLGLPFEAVVFCDHGGEQRLLRRGRAEPVKLAHCTLPTERRFVFYDQVHTTGIDIRHASWACAALTLGKDTTFRDFAQGAYRMRGIGRGQRLKILLTPEISGRINEDIVPVPESSAAVEAPLLDRVCAWLLVRQAASEHAQHHLLRRQGILYEGRRCAFEARLAKLQDSAHDDSQVENQALDLFRERVDYTIDTTLIGEGPTSERSLSDLAQRVSHFLDEAGQKAVQELIGPLTQSSNSKEDLDKMEAQGMQEQKLFVEMEQEHEQELFAEQEEEQQEEEEEEEEEEQHGEDAKASASIAWQPLRKEEPPEPWRLVELAQQPCAGAVFYPSTKLEVAPAIGATSRTGTEISANFPSELWVSSNFHSPERGRGPCRLKAPFAVLEWVPDTSCLGCEDDEDAVWPDSPSREDFHRQQSGASSSCTDHWSRLKLALGLQDLQGKASISEQETKTLLASIGISAGQEEVKRVLDAIEAQARDDIKAYDMEDGFMDTISPPSSPTAARKLRKAISVTTTARALLRSHALKPQRGRFYLLLSLAEAEFVRALMHRLTPHEPLIPGKPSCQVALRVLCREPLGLSLLDQTKGFVAAPFRWQEQRIAQSLLFLGAEPNLTNAELDSLWCQLRARLPPVQLERPSLGKASSGELLKDFFVASQSVRRRCLLEGDIWQECSVCRLFQDEKVYIRNRNQLVLSRAYAKLLASGLTPEAIFAKLDEDCDGEVLPGDFAKSAQLGIIFPPNLLLMLYEIMDTAHRGSVSEEEFLAAFELSSRAVRPQAVLNPSIAGEEPPPPPEAVPLEVLRRLAIELVSHSSYTLVWSSEGVLSRKTLSIWAPDQLVSGFLRVTALRFSLGHYANQGFSDAKSGCANGVGRRLILQVRDKRAFSSSSSSDYLQAVVDHYCPFPVKYRLIWNQQRGKPLFVWRPVPPSEAFVALGMVATTTPEPPSVEEVRCVPKSFCRPSQQAPVQLWDDKGSGGKPASMWLVNSLQVMWVTVGHAAPHDHFWELASDSITFDYTGTPSVHVVHERQDADVSAGSVISQVDTDESWSLTALFTARSSLRRLSVGQ